MRRSQLAWLLVAIVAVAVAFSILSAVRETSGTRVKLPQPIAPLLQGKPDNIRVWVEGARDGKPPVEYTCDAPRFTAPRIQWTGLKNAKSYVVLVLDPDAPLGTFIHLLAYDGDKPEWPAPGYKLGLNSAGKLGWYPICPPRGDKPHHYYFIVIALNKTLRLDTGATLEQVLASLDESIIGYGYTVLTYKR